MSAFSKSKHHQQPHNQVPDTVTGGVGSAKRNIIRRGGGGSRGRKEGLSGKAIDDGSLYEDPKALDEDDPNYDSEEETGFVAIPKYASLYREDIAKSSMTLTQYKKAIEPFIKEYFVSGDLNEIARSIQEIEAHEYAYEFVKRIINMSLDQGDRERELVSTLLSDFYPDLLSSNMIGKGFERIFEIVDEIEKDAPNAHMTIATFLARAVMDEVLPPSFLSDSVVRNLGGEIIDHAKAMLSRDHAGAKLEHSWGPGDGRPVEDLKVAIDLIIDEFLVNGDAMEATRCLVEVNAPQFYHEIVKRMITASMDKSAEQQERMSELIHNLHRNEILSNQQAAQGFQKLHDKMADIVLDTPTAPRILAEFTERAKRDGVLSAAFTGAANGHTV